MSNQNSLEQENTVQSGKNGPEMVQKWSSKGGKDTIDYWKGRLERREYGKGAEVQSWQVKIQHLGRREWFNLQTNNKEIAAQKARDIWKFLSGNGWNLTLERFKPKSAVQKVCTVGEYLSQVQAVGGLTPITFRAYCTKLRTLLAGIFNLHGDASKSDYHGGGAEKWRQRVDRIRLDKITPERIQKWRVHYLQQAQDPLQVKHATITANSIIRNSKALFSKKVLKNLNITLPNPLPFSGVDFLKQPKTRYRSEINPQLLLMQAARELKETSPELFKIVLLALGAGLRRDEIDTLSWRQMDFARNQIHVETNEYTTTKSGDSEASIDVDPGLMTIFQDYMATSQSPFVVNSQNQPKPMNDWHHYRCMNLFRKVTDWLHTKGITARNPLHSLRKEYGSQICAQAGIFAASEALRHSSIQLTREHYVDKKVTTVFKVADMLKEATGQ